MKKISFYILFTIVATLSLQAQSKLQEYINTGNQNLKDRNFKDAVDNFSKAIKEQPNDTAALSGIIKASLLTDDLKESQKHIDNAIKLYPDNAEFIFRRGILNNKKGQFGKAIEDFNKALNMNLSNSLKAQVYLNLGATQIKEETFDQALESYKKALELSPRNPSIYNYKGYANYKLANFSDAINDYNNAIDLDPNIAVSYYNRGMAYLKSSEKQKACLDFHKSCQMGNINACKMIMSECTNK